MFNSPLSILVAVFLVSGSKVLAESVDVVSSQLFESQSMGNNGTMFSKIAELDTGVITENRYNDQRIWRERYHEFSVGAIGTGVAVGDFDGDGLPDIFVVSKTESCRLFRNRGNWQFEDVSEAAGVADVGVAAAEWKQGASFVDINNDGWLDLYLCRFAAPNLLYVNQGDGTFREEGEARGLAVIDGSAMGAFADYDRDGWLDVYLQTNVLDKLAHPAGQPDRLFRNRGDGYFVETTKEAGIEGDCQGHSATWWDYDEDGWPDIYVANDFSVGDRLYRNNGDGTFHDVIDLVVPHMPHHAMGADLGDMNNDGRMDLFVAEMARDSHESEMRTAAETRSGQRLEVSTSSRAPQTMRNALYLNSGMGRMQEIAQIAGLSATNWTWSARWEDFDNDGRLDLHISNGMVREYDSYDLRTRAMAAESPAERVRVMMSSPVLNETNLVFRNLGNLRFEEKGLEWGLNQTGVSFGVATGDFDGDGDLDLVVSNYQAGVSLLRNDSVNGSRVVIALRGTESNRFGVGATVRLTATDGSVQVRQLWLARGYLSNSEPVVHFGLGTATGVEHLVITWPSGIKQKVEGLDAGRRYTISEPQTSTLVGLSAVVEHGEEPEFEEVGARVGLDLIAPEAEFDEESRQPLLPRMLEHESPSFVVSDLDGDGVEDVVMGGTTGAAVQVRRGQVDGKFVHWENTGLEGGGKLNDGPMAAFDADADGDTDLLVTRAGMTGFAGMRDYQPRLWLNDGTGSFEQASESWLPRFPVNVGALVAADFDGDGRTDLFLGGRAVPGQYPLAPISEVWLNRGDRYEELSEGAVVGLRHQGMVTGALACDVDDDGWLDLVVTLEWGGVRFWRNQAGQGFEDRSEMFGFDQAGTGLWQCVATGDFNADGRPDFALGNWGLNSPYRATREEPLRLFMGDFSGKGAPVLVEAVYENGRLLPRRSRSQLGRQIGSILRQFPTASAYAKADLEDLLGVEQLAQAESYVVTELRSGVLLSQGDGSYGFKPFEGMGQIAPVRHMVALDWDGDGDQDLAQVHNLFGAASDIGRLDGGLGQILCGDGLGNFECVPAVQSGWVVPKEGVAVVSIAGGGNNSPRLWVIRNQAPALVFQHRLDRP